MQRAAAEVWATVLRKLKKDERMECVWMMIMNDSDTGIEDALAYSFVFAIRVSM